MAGQIQLRLHARETLKAALQRGWPVHILSVNWSSALIKATLAGLPCRVASDAASGEFDDSLGTKSVAVHANSLEMQLGISTG